jgi:DNA-binding NtrC family response regulator
MLEYHEYIKFFFRKTPVRLALVFEMTAGVSQSTLQAVRCNNYLAIPVFTVKQALSSIKATKFDLVVLHTCVQPDSKQSLAATLKYFAPRTTVVLVTDDLLEIASAARDVHACVNIVLRRPFSQETLREKLEYGIDGHGSQRRYFGPVASV